MLHVFLRVYRQCHCIKRNTSMSRMQQLKGLTIVFIAFCSRLRSHSCLRVIDKNAIFGECGICLGYTVSNASNISVDVNSKLVMDGLIQGL